MKDKLLAIALICIVISLSGCTSIPSIQIPSLWGQSKPTIQPSGQLNSIIIDQTIPGAMLPGKKYNITVTMQNNGFLSWSATNQTVLAPYSDSGSDTLIFNNSTFGISPGNVIKTGSDYTWYINVIAPQWVGNYTIKYRMMDGNGSYFGSIVNKTVIVGDLNNTVVFLTKGDAYYPPLVNMKIKKGTIQNVSITVKNMGRYDWTADQVSLQVVDYEPNNATLFNPALSYYLAPESVINPGDQCTWKFKLHAPLETGIYQLKYRMKNGDEWYGKMLTTNITVT